MALSVGFGRQRFDILTVFDAMFEKMLRRLSLTNLENSTHGRENRIKFNKNTIASLKSNMV